MGSYLNFVQCAVVFFFCMVNAVVDSTGNALVFVSKHKNSSFLRGIPRQMMRYRFSMSEIRYFISKIIS